MSSPIATEQRDSQEPQRSALDVGLVSLIVGLATAAGFLAQFLERGSLLRAPFAVPLWALAAGFALSERWIIHMPIRRSTHTLTLSEIVFVVALLFGGPLVALMAQVIGGAIGLTIDVVVPWERKFFNVANYALSACVGALFFQFTTSRGGLSTQAWLAAIGASLVMSACSLGGIAAAMSVTQQRPATEQLVAMFKAGLTATGIDAALGVLMVITLWQSPVAALLFVPLIGGMFLSARTFVEQRRHRERLEVLHDLTATLLETSNVEDGLRHVLDKILAIFVCEHADVRLAGMDSGGRGFDGQQGMIEWNDGQGHYGLSLPLMLDAKQVSSNRLVLQGRLVSAGPFTKEEKSFAEMIAQHLSMMLRHAKLVDALAAVRQEIRVDPLTGIGNRRQLQESFERAQDDAQESTLVTLDLDGFKNVNDRFGHDTGDTVLVAVARSLRANVSTTDVPVRLGGDEFGVLVVGDGHRDRAADLAERLRLDLTLSFDETLPEPVGASLGVASAVTGEGLRDLLRRADLAMYQAKRAGKGRVVVSGPASTSDVDESSRA